MLIIRIGSLLDLCYHSLIYERRHVATQEGHRLRMIMRDGDLFLSAQDLFNMLEADYASWDEEDSDPDGRAWITTYLEGVINRIRGAIINRRSV